MLFSKNFPHNRATGFTLVELVVVIVLISVLAVSAYSRFGGSAGYAEYTYQSRLISALRNMQTRAMFDTRAVDPSNGKYCFQINLSTAPHGFGPPALVHYKTDNVTNRAATCNSNIDRSSDTPEYLYTSTTEMVEEGVSISAVNSDNDTISFINFNSLGQPSTNQSAACGTECKITFIGESSVSVCVNEQGYIYACE